MESLERIRREYEFGVGTISGVSRKLGVHRRMVREALSTVGAGGEQAATAAIARTTRVS